MIRKLPLGHLRTPNDLQPRVSMNGDLISEYASILRQDDDFDFPPVVVFYDGSDYWLADGFHRLGGYRTGQRFEIPAEVHEGTRRDALRYSLSANANHGLRRTNEDKRRAVLAAIRDEEWGKWTNCEQARLCAVTEGLVRRVKESLRTVRSENPSPDAPPASAPEQPTTRTYTTKHGTQAQMNTKNIGRKGKKEKKEKQPEQKRCQPANTTEANSDSEFVSEDDWQPEVDSYNEEESRMKDELPQNIPRHDSMQPIVMQIQTSTPHEDLDPILKQLLQLWNAASMSVRQRFLASIN